MTKRNHVADVAAMAKLAGEWKPDNLAGYKVGDAVKLPNIECTFQIVGLDPPALLVLESPSGHQLRAGWRAVRRVKTQTRGHDR